MRQNEVATLVIRGKKLGRTTSVNVGMFLPRLHQVTEHEVRVTAFGDGLTLLVQIDIVLRSGSVKLALSSGSSILATPQP